MSGRERPSAKPSPDPAGADSEPPTPGGPDDEEEVPAPAWARFVLVALPLAVVLGLMLLESWLR